MKKIHKIATVMFVLIACFSSQSMSAAATNVKCKKCVGTSDIAKDAVTGSRIKNNADTTSKIQNGAVDFDKLGPDVQVILDTIETPEGGTSIKAVDANDLVIGELVSFNGEDGSFDVFTTQGYLEVDVPMSPDLTVGEHELRYLTTDCTGVPYIGYANGTVYLTLQLDTTYAKYYTPKDTVAQNVTIQSYVSSWSGPSR
jgi:hypothetical protein